jgi:tetratricopeptide (TPR) repeat protein
MREAPPERRRPAPCGLVLVAGLVGLAAAPPPDPIALGLRDLHHGLYARAEEGLRAAAREAPGDPEPLLYLAFSHWWRLLQGTGAPDEAAAFAAASDAALAAAERRLREAPDDLPALAAAGTARILRGHMAARRRSFREAAQEARRGRRALEAVLERDPSFTDALFPLGAYNYYFDQIPALAKGLRLLLLLPAGDSELGLRQLREAAASVGRFRTDARLLLALICGSRQERCYAGALAHLAIAREEHPDSPVIHASIGTLHLRLGQYPEALASLARALEAAGGPEADRVRQRRQIRLLMAEALLGDWRLAEAEEALRAAAREGGDPGEDERQAADRLAAELAWRRGDSGAGEGPAAGLPRLLEEALREDREGRGDAALEALRRAAAAAPAHPLPRFLAGRALCLAGRFEEAGAELRAASERMREAPSWLLGWTEIYLGLAEAGLGRRRAARAHFERAGEVRRFRAADRAFLELDRGRPADGRCAAP